MKRRNVSKRAEGKRPQDIDPEARAIEDALADADLEALESVDVEVNPVLIEQARSRHKLKQITIRVGEEQLEIARKVAAKRGEKYQQTLRRWLAEGAYKALAQIGR